MGLSKRFKTTRRRKSTQRQRAGRPAPDLAAILDALFDAQSLITVAHKVIVDGDVPYGPEEFVLRQGVEALKRVNDDLEQAVLALRPTRAGK